MRDGLLRRSTWMALATLLLAPAACRPHRGAGDELSAANQGEFVLRIVNNYWLDVTVYVVRGAERVRVGTVSGNSRQDFVLPAAVLGPSRQISLFGDVATSHEVVRSQPVLVERGQFVEWRLESALYNSSVTVY